MENFDYLDPERDKVKVGSDLFYFPDPSKFDKIWLVSVTKFNDDSISFIHLDEERKGEEGEDRWANFKVLKTWST